MWGLVLFYMLMSLNVVALLYALYLVPPEIMKDHVCPFYFLIPFPPFIIGSDFSITGYAAVIYFFLMAGAIFLSFYSLIRRDGKRLFDIGSRLLSDGEPTREVKEDYDDNSFVLVGELFMAILFFDIVFIIFLAIIGQEMHTPEFLEEADTWELMVALAVASVWEEVVSRVLLIGVPLLIGKGLSKRTASHTSPEAGSSGEKRWYNYLVGGGFKITPVTALLILISSLLFGLAHASSWDYFKVIPVVLSGLAFGYLFVRKGVQASIILHFAFDYLGILPDALGSGEGDAMNVFIGLFLLVLLFVGALMFYKYARRFLRYTGELFVGGSDGKRDYGHR